MLCSNYLLARTNCEISPKLTLKTPEDTWSGIFLVYFEQIPEIVQVLLLLSENR